MKYLLLAVLFLPAQFAIADSYRSIGTIYRMGTILNRDNVDYMIISGFTSAGTCPLSEGLVVARFPNNDRGARAYSMALAAKMSNNEGQIRIKSQVKLRLNCI